MLTGCACTRHGAARIVLCAAILWALGAGAAHAADFEVTAPGGWAGDTCGAGNDCALRPSPDHEYLIHIPTAGNWTFSICHAGWDTWMALGETPCSMVWYNDDAPGCGGASKIIVNNLPAGDYHLTIEGFSMSFCGTYTLMIHDDQPCAAPECPDGAMLSQPPTTPDGPWEQSVANYDPLNELVYFETYDVPSDVEGVRWWGVLTGFASASCFEDPMEFVVQFYADDGTGHPDYQNPHSFYFVNVQPQLVPCVYDDHMLVQFTAEVDPPCPLRGGWVSIGGNGQDCDFSWMSSEEGDGSSIYVLEQSGQPYWTIQDHDRSVCLTHACAGDVNGDGTVDVLDLLALLAAWGPCSGTCPEDLNADGVVNVLDLLALLAAWGPCS